MVIEKSNWWLLNQILLQQMELFEEDYRQKVCANCSVAEQKKRGCTIYEGKYTYCKHLKKARSLKFREKIEKQIFSLSPVAQITGRYSG